MFPEVKVAELTTWLYSVPAILTAPANLPMEAPSFQEPKGWIKLFIWSFQIYIDSNYWTSWTSWPIQPLSFVFIYLPETLWKQKQSFQKAVGKSISTK